MAQGSVLPEQVGLNLGLGLGIHRELWGEDPGPALGGSQVLGTSGLMSFHLGRDPHTSLKISLHRHGPGPEDRTRPRGHVTCPSRCG